MDNDGLQEGSQRKEARQLHSLYGVLGKWLFATWLVGVCFLLLMRQAKHEPAFFGQDQSATGPASDSHRIFLAAT